MKYLIDTNICIYLIKRKPPEVIQKLKRLHMDTIGISAITVSELEYGIEKSAHTEQNRIALLEFLVPFTILDYDQEASSEYGRIRTALEKKGKPIGAMDLLIAAHAKSKGLILVTNNEKEFKRVEGLQVENWVKSNKK
ncbi:type II toxin-antitoxin system VapC family toxin [Planctomycetota bacterium]